MLAQSKAGDLELRIWWQRKHGAHRSAAWEDRTPGDLLEEFYLDRIIDLRDARRDIKEENANTVALSQRIDELERLFSDEEEEKEENFDDWIEKQSDEWKDVSLNFREE